MTRLIASSLVLATCFLSASAALAVDLPLRSDRAAVQQAYYVISDPNADTREIYLGLNTDLQGDLWAMQLEEFLAANPKLTTEQYSVLAEAIGLLSTGIHRRQKGDSDDAARAMASVDHLTSRIKMAFTRAEGMFFGQLGQSAVDSSLAALAARDAMAGDADLDDKRLAPRIQGYTTRGPIQANSECECSSVSDWCYQTPTSPDNSCTVRPGQCTRTTAGCGTFWQYGCNGLCGGF